MNKCEKCSKNLKDSKTKYCKKCEHELKMELFDAFINGEIDNE